MPREWKPEDLRVGMWLGHPGQPPRYYLKKFLGAATWVLAWTAQGQLSAGTTTYMDRTICNNLNNGQWIFDGYFCHCGQVIVGQEDYICEGCRRGLGAVA